MTSERRSSVEADVVLPAGLSRLMEQLAEHVHDQWAKQRRADGWQYGPQRDDTKKRHPNLIPYDELAEAEKQYDRLLARQTMRFILDHGYRVLPSQESMPQAQPVQALPSTSTPMPTWGERSLADAWRSWRSIDPQRWSDYLAASRSLAEDLLARDAPLLAFDVAQAALRIAPGDPYLRRARALALARSGATTRAQSELAELVKHDPHDAEAVGMLARTYKDLGMAAASSRERRKLLKIARRWYERIFARPPHLIWHGINAATLARLLDETEEADRLSAATADRCRDLLSGELEPAEEYWTRATLAECLLVQGHYEEAVSTYAHAFAVGRRRRGSVGSTLRQARLLCEHCEVNFEPIRAALRLPRVVVFAGHMLDRPERPSARLPASMESMIRDAIRHELHKLDAGYGFSSAACGSDILFLEEMLRRPDARVRIVLPCAEEHFIAESVAAGAASGWEQRFQHVCDQDPALTLASLQGLAPGSISYDYANQVLLGLALLEAGRSGEQPICLAVWDGQPGDGTGGTADMVRRCRELNVEVRIIDPADGRALGPSYSARPSPKQARDEVQTVEIAALTFVDAKGFSRLAEDKMQPFVENVFGEVRRLLDGGQYEVKCIESRGDGLFAVFGDLDSAARLALDLASGDRPQRWSALDFPPDFGLRIALHAGPVLRFQDPLTGGLSYTGTHVTHAARIEPVTPTGEVYASQHFAALVAANPRPDRGFHCEYVGQTALAKGYGVQPLYVIRPK